MTEKITPAMIKRRAFAEGVAAGKSATQAYKDAGYKSVGNVAEVEASRLLRNPQVASRIAELTAEASKGRRMTVAERHRILEQIAAGEVEQEISTITDSETGRTVSVQRRKPTAGERKAALEHLDNLDGLVKQHVEHTGKGGGAIAVMLGQIPEDVMRARLAELLERGKSAP